MRHLRNVKSIMLSRKQAQKENPRTFSSGFSSLTTLLRERPCVVYPINGLSVTRHNCAEIGRKIIIVGYTRFHCHSRSIFFDNVEQQSATLGVLVCQRLIIVYCQNS